MALATINPMQMSKPVITVVSPNERPSTPLAVKTEAAPRTPIPPGTSTRMPHMMVTNDWWWVTRAMSCPQMPTHSAATATAELVSIKANPLGDKARKAYQPTKADSTLDHHWEGRLLRRMLKVRLMSSRKTGEYQEDALKGHPRVISSSLILAHRISREPIASPKPCCMATITAPKNRADPDTMHLADSSATAMAMVSPGSSHTMPARAVAKGQYSEVAVEMAKETKLIVSAVKKPSSGRNCAYWSSQMHNPPVTR